MRVRKENFFESQKSSELVEKPNSQALKNLIAYNRINIFDVII